MLKNSGVGIVHLTTKKVQSARHLDYGTLPHQTYTLEYPAPKAKRAGKTPALFATIRGKASGKKMIYVGVDKISSGESLKSI